MGHVAVIIGGAARALVGLLFVSVSIRIEVISASPDFRSRAAETLTPDPPARGGDTEMSAARRHPTAHGP